MPNKKKKKKSLQYTFIKMLVSKAWLRAGFFTRHSRGRPSSERCGLILRSEKEIMVVNTVSHSFTFLTASFTDLGHKERISVHLWPDSLVHLPQRCSYKNELLNTFTAWCKLLKLLLCLSHLQNSNCILYIVIQADFFTFWLHGNNAENNKNNVSIINHMG